MSPVVLLAALALATTPPASLPQTLSLDEALSLGRANLPTIKASEAAATAAQERARGTLGGLLPQVSFNASYRRSTVNTVPQPGVPSTEGGSVSLASADFLSAGLTAQATIWDFGRSWNRYDASKASAAAARSQLELAQVQGDFGVRSAYFAAAAQRALVEVAQATLENTQAHQKQIEGFVQVGTRPEIDLAQAKADTANARLALVTARTNSQVAKARLQRAIGVTGSLDFEVSSQEPGAVDGEARDADALVPVALGERADAEAFDAQLEAQQYAVKSAQGGYWPIISAQLSASVNARLPNTTQPNLAAQVAFTWPLYEGGQVMAAVRESEATMTQLRAQREALGQQVRLELQESLLQVAAAREGVEVAGEARAATKERLRLAEGRYQAGSGNVLELGDAQVAFTQASAQEVQARWSLATARAQLLVALGR